MRPPIYIKSYFLPTFHISMVLSNGQMYNFVSAIFARRYKIQINSQYTLDWLDYWVDSIFFFMQGGPVNSLPVVSEFISFTFIWEPYARDLWFLDTFRTTDVYYYIKVSKLITLRCVLSFERRIRRQLVRKFTYWATFCEKENRVNSVVKWSQSKVYCELI